MNKTLLKSVREYKKQSVLAPLFVILEVLMEVLIPMEMAKIIDTGIAEGNYLHCTAGTDSCSHGHAGSLVWCDCRKDGCYRCGRLCQEPAA